MVKTINVKSYNYTYGRALPVTTVVAHYTASDNAKSAVRWFANSASKVSAHYVIDRDGTVYKCVEAQNVAWHAGESVGPNGSNVNAYSIGVELVGRGETYTDKQYDALVELIKCLKTQFQSLKWVTGHDQVCQPPGRKSDPGPHFDYERVAKAAELAVWRRQT